MPHRVVTLLSPGANPFEFAVACEVFGGLPPTVGTSWYEHRLVAATSPLVVEGGWTLATVDGGVEVLQTADTLVVPAGPTDAPAAVIEQVRRAHDRGARIVGLCSGAFTLAAAGVLDGRAATTHWMLAHEFAERYPRVDVRPDVLYVDEGEVLTSAGTAAAIDLALHVVRQDHGAEAAAQIARRMVVPPHRHGEREQVVADPVARRPYPVDGVQAVLQWAERHLDEPITVGMLAEMAAMSPRTLLRRFRDVTGTTPGRWLGHQRVLAAQRLLEATDLTVDQVAREIGFGTAANLRRHFRRATGTSPTAHRRTHQHR